MAQFSSQDYIWMREAWTQLINTAAKEDRAIICAACLKFATLLASNSKGFDRTRFISEVRQQLTD